MAQAWTELDVGRTREGGNDTEATARAPTLTHHRLATAASAGLYLGGAVFNALLTVPEARDVFESFRDTAWLGPYRWLIDNVILSAPTACAVALAAFELTLGVAIIAGGRPRRVALVAATAFVIGLIPSLSWPYWTANVGLAALQVAFLRRLSK